MRKIRVATLITLAAFAGMPRPADGATGDTPPLTNSVGNASSQEPRSVSDQQSTGAPVALNFPREDRGWIDVNIGLADAAQDAYPGVYNKPLFSQTATFTARYLVPRGASFDFGGGYMFSRVGVGVSFGGTAHENVAGLTISIPHPLFFNRIAGTSSNTPYVLRRVEGAAHVQAMVALTPPLSAIRVRAFAGPSFFRVQQDTVNEILYNQFYNGVGGNSVSILSSTALATDVSGLGFHVGSDVSYFFSRVVGVGGIVRFSRANLDLPDLGGTTTAITAGGVQYGVGLRLKF